MKAERLDGLTACPGVLVAEQQNRTKTKKPRNQNFEETFWFRLKRCFFLVFLVFFFVFWFRSPKNQKTPGVFWFFQVHGWRQSPKNQKTPGVFLVFWTSKPKKPKKHKENQKNPSFESKPKSLLKVLVFWFFVFLFFWFSLCFWVLILFLSK